MSSGVNGLLWGGTGEFSMATGVIYKKFHKKTTEGDIVELTIHGFCPVLKGSKQVRTNIAQYFFFERPGTLSGIH